MSEAALHTLEQARIYQPRQDLKVLNLETFLAMDIPPRENIIAPILQTQSLSMLFAARGVGKTHVALNLAYAIATGGTFLKWTAPKPRKVLYLDGEMSAREMQERLAKIVRVNDKPIDPDYFKLITPDFQDLGMPDLSTPEGQKRMVPYTSEAELIIVDNISTLCRTGKENEAEGWLTTQAWALDLRSQGKSVLFIHHAGKGGQQRGTSRREDVLDTVIELRHPDDYSTEEGARFEVHFTKARHLVGPDAKPFEAQLGPDGWTYRDIEDAAIAWVIKLNAEGLSLREIENETGISKSRVQRILKQHEAG